jgi:hypothetical protein
VVGKPRPGYQQQQDEHDQQYDEYDAEITNREQGT